MAIYELDSPQRVAVAMMQDTLKAWRGLFSEGECPPWPRRARYDLISGIADLERAIRSVLKGEPHV